MIHDQQAANDQKIILPPADDDESRIRDKVVLIIGGANENGRSLATELAANGAHVALIYHQSASDEANKTRRMVEALERNCLLIPTGTENDKREFAKFAVKHVVDSLGRLDVFIDYSAQAKQIEMPGQNEYANRKTPDVFPGVGMLVAAMNQIAVRNV